MPSRSPADLAPALRYAHDLWLHDCKVAGIDVLVTCTYRSQAEQDALYAIGRTLPGRKVTWTRNSRHSVTGSGGQPASEAFDFVPLTHGKPVWTATDPLWAKCGELSEKHHLEWGGRWAPGKRDLPHIQLPARG